MQKSTAHTNTSHSSGLHACTFTMQVQYSPNSTASLVAEKKRTCPFGQRLHEDRMEMHLRVLLIELGPLCVMEVECHPFPYFRLTQNVKEVQLNRLGSTIPALHITMCAGVTIRLSHRVHITYVQ